MIKMICLDLDGTLLNSKKEIDENTYSYLNELSSKGIEIVIATGRHYDYANFLTRNLTDDKIIISNNGSGIFRPKDNKTLKVNYLDRSIAKDLARISINNGFNPLLYVNPLTRPCDLFTYEINESYVGSIVTGVDRMQQLNLSIIDDVLSLVITGPFKDLYKLQLYIDNQYSNKVNSHIMNASEEDLGLLEVMDTLANKWTACEYYANINGFKNEEILAFGDEINDIEMIRHAGVGIAMKNSIDAVKLYADKISKYDNNNAGVYNELKEMFE